MKKKIITATLFVSTVVLFASCAKRNDIKPEANYKVSTFDDRKDVGSAD
jgi:hypothetical protein